MRAAKGAGTATIGGVLGEILAAKRRRLAAGEFNVRETHAVRSDGSRFLSALKQPGARVIAEFKHRSPSAGHLIPEPDAALVSIAHSYRRGGAAAISVVTEQDFFGGDPSWLPRVKEASGLPVLMKDFVIDERQLDFALALGADAVLLIAAALPGSALESSYRAALDRSLAVLVEVHDEEEARRAAALTPLPELVGVNSRNLATFGVDLGLLARVADGLPRETLRVAESGIRSREDVVGLTAGGFSAFLVGEALLRAPDAARELRRFQGLGETETKICGLTREEDLEVCRGLGVDYVGFNLSPRSKRRVTLERARELARRVRFAKGVVLVFSGNTREEILRSTDEIDPDILQITDPPGFFQQDRPDGRPFDWPRAVWSVTRVEADGRGIAPMEAPAYANAAARLFDTTSEGLDGGTGRTFDWSALTRIPRDRPIVLAGGLNASNVVSAIQQARPDVVDVASGVEREPGVKDPEKLAAFVAAVRRTA